MIIPLKPLKYTVAIGNLIHLVLWSILEGWILTCLILSLLNAKNNPWVYVQCSPIVFYIMIIKFFGFYGAYTQNHIFVVIHIMSSTIYILAIALSLIHVTLFGEDRTTKPNAFQRVLSVIYHLTNFILLILSVILFFVLRALQSAMSSLKTEEESPGSASEFNANKVESGKAKAKESDNPLFRRLVVKKDKDVKTNQ